MFATVDENALCSGSSCKFDLYAMNADGTDVTRLTATPERESVPTWSPDARQIAFVRHATFENGGGGQILVMNADGSGEHVVLPGPADVMGLGWSPSGNQLVYAKPRRHADARVARPRIPAVRFR